MGPFGEPTPYQVYSLESPWPLAALAVRLAQNRADRPQRDEWSEFLAPGGKEGQASLATLARSFGHQHVLLSATARRQATLANSRPGTGAAQIIIRLIAPDLAEPRLMLEVP